ncbi:MAG: ComEC/Rec2 family competence protein [Planctomycetota bacterium]
MRPRPDAPAGLSAPPPFVVALACTACGILLADQFGMLFDAWIIGLTGALVTLIAARFERFRKIFFPIAIALTSFTWATIQLHERPSDFVRLSADSATLVRIEGTVVQMPTLRTRSAGALADLSFRNTPRTTLLVDVRLSGPPNTTELARASGRLFLTVQGDATRIRAGSRIKTVALAQAPSPPLNPGGFEPDRWASDGRIIGFGRIADLEAIEVVREPPWWSFTLWRDLLRERAGAWLASLPEGSSSSQFLGAIILGERSSGYEELNQPFVRQGVAHVLAISGLHLAALAGMVVFLLRLVGDHPRVEAIIVLLLVLALLMLVPARPPIMRASLMVIVYTVANLAGRRYAPLNLLALVALIIVAWRPSELFLMGYQLSFAVVAGLLTLTTPLRDRVFGLPGDRELESMRDRMLTWIQTSLCASIVAWLIATPIVIFHTGWVSWLAIITSFLILPVVTLLLGAGALVTTISLVSPGIADPLARPLGYVAEMFADAVLAFDAGTISAFRIPPIDPLWPWAMIACLAIAIRLWISRLAMALSTVALLGWAFLSSHLHSRMGSDEFLRWHTIAVGDGTCHAIRTHDQTVLFDAGSLNLGMGLADIPDTLRELGITSVDTLVLSHPDLDHYSASIDLLTPLGIDRVLMGERFFEDAERNPDGGANRVLDAMSKRGIPVKKAGQGQQLLLSEQTRAECLSPYVGVESSVTDNDAALVWLIRTQTQTGERRLLLTSDIEEFGQSETLSTLQTNAEDELFVDVLEVPHHGSARSFAFEFVSAINPRIVVQSTGPKRLNDERWDNVKQGRTWFTTAGDGLITITIRTDGKIEAGAHSLDDGTTVFEIEDTPSSPKDGSKESH